MTAAVAPKKFLDSTYLKQSMPEDNLDRLSDPKFFVAPATGCMTREIYKKVPYFKPTADSIRKWSFGIGFAPTVARFGYLFFKDMGICVASKNNWETNFFTFSSECFVKGIQNMNTNYNRFWMGWGVVWSVFTGLLLYSAARIALQDYSEQTRVDMLDKEYSALATHLIDTFDKAGNDEAAKRSVLETAHRLKTNLPLIESQLKKTARISEENAAKLIQKLKSALNEVLGEKR